MVLTLTDNQVIQTQSDVVLARQLVRTRAVAIGMGLVDQTKLVTAASELARNTLIYGKGGTMSLSVAANGLRKGIQLIFEDHGPGIPDIQKALEDGYTTGGGMGLGLGGAKRLVHEFSIESHVGQGTRVMILRWK